MWKHEPREDLCMKHNEQGRLQRVRDWLLLFGETRWTRLVCLAVLCSASGCLVPEYCLSWQVIRSKKVKEVKSRLSKERECRNRICWKTEFETPMKFGRSGTDIFTCKGRKTPRPNKFKQSNTWGSSWHSNSGPDFLYYGHLVRRWHLLVTCCQRTNWAIEGHPLHHRVNQTQLRLWLSRTPLTTALLWLGMSYLTGGETTSTLWLVIDGRRYISHRYLTRTLTRVVQVTI